MCDHRAGRTPAGRLPTKAPCGNWSRACIPLRDAVREVTPHMMQGQIGEEIGLHLREAWGHFGRGRGHRGSVAVRASDGREEPLCPKLNLR